MFFEGSPRAQWARKLKKSPGQKKTRGNKVNKPISRFFFCQIPFFAISKLAKNQFLNWGKLPKMQFHEKKVFDLFDFTSFLSGLF